VVFPCARAGPGVQRFGRYGAHNVTSGVRGVFARNVVGVIERQSGAIARRQLLRLGVTPDAIKHALASDRLVAVFRGVYATGPLPDRGRIIAALLAAGRKAVASHRTAAFLYELLSTLPAVIEVTLLDRRARSQPGLKIHTTTLPFEIRRRRGIPLTAPLRTLQDLPSPQAERLTSEALVRRLITPDQLPQGRAPTRSPLEDGLLALIRKAGLPVPEVNVRVGEHTVDFLWRDQRVIVETDGYATHGHHAAFERDRARDAALLAAGYIVLRFTHRQVTREPLTVVAALTAALTRRAAA
jgi:very-short-patch-repair endonuclease